MISEFTPPGIQVIALRGGKERGVGEIVKGQLYTVRGFVICRHWRTREPDPHVLLEEVARPRGQRGEVGYPRDAFEIPALTKTQRVLEAV